MTGAAWRSDTEFRRVAKRRWRHDYARATKGGYDGGAAQRLTYRYQGWTACKPAKS